MTVTQKLLNSPTKYVRVIGAVWVFTILERLVNETYKEESYLYMSQLLKIKLISKCFIT